MTCKNVNSSSNSPKFFDCTDFGMNGATLLKVSLVALTVLAIGTAIWVSLPQNHLITKILAQEYQIALGVAIGGVGSGIPLLIWQLHAYCNTTPMENPSQQPPTIKTGQSTIVQQQPSTIQSGPSTIVQQQQLIENENFIADENFEGLGHFEDDDDLEKNNLETINSETEKSQEKNSEIKSAGEENSKVDSSETKISNSQVKVSKKMVKTGQPKPKPANIKWKALSLKDSAFLPPEMSITTKLNAEEFIIDLSGKLEFISNNRAELNEPKNDINLLVYVITQSFAECMSLDVWKELSFEEITYLVTSTITWIDPKPVLELVNKLESLVKHTRSLETFMKGQCLNKKSFESLQKYLIENKSFLSKFPLIEKKIITQLMMIYGITFKRLASPTQAIHDKMQDLEILEIYLLPKENFIWEQFPKIKEGMIGNLSTCASNGFLGHKFIFPEEKSTVIKIQKSINVIAEKLGCSAPELKIDMEERDESLEVFKEQAAKYQTMYDRKLKLGKSPEEAQKFTNAAFNRFLKYDVPSSEERDAYAEKVPSFVNFCLIAD